MAKRNLPPQDYLRQCFDYDPETGALTWRERPREHFKSAQAWGAWNTKFAGKQTGCPGGWGYLVVGLGGKNWQLHRLAWRMVHGTEPEEIDHINRVRDDNRLANLRECTSQQNKWNTLCRRSSRWGRKGVGRQNSKKESYIARIALNGKTYCLGTYATVEEAHAAYQAAARRLHGEFFRQNHST